MRIFLVLLFLSSAAAAGEPYLVVLDFASDFDKGNLGRKIGTMFRAKSSRKKLYVVDAEYEWEDRAGLMVSPAIDADPVTVADAAQKAFGCDVLIWGVLTRPQPAVPEKVVEHKGHTTASRQNTALTFEVRAVDIKKKRLLLKKTYQCAINFELTAKVDEVIKSLTGAATRADVEAAHPSNRMLAFGRELCAGGAFSTGIGMPWETLPGWHWPVHKGISFGTEKGNRFLHYDISRKVADNEGLFCYSPYVEIKSDTYYQVSFRVRTFAPKVIMFVKGYKDIEFHDLDTVKRHRQEVSKHQKRWYGEKKKWGTLVSRPFLPKSAKKKHMPEFVRVQLYAYHPMGIVDFDDVSVRECLDPQKVQLMLPTKPDEKSLLSEKSAAGLARLLTGKPSRPAKVGEVVATFIINGQGYQWDGTQIVLKQNDELLAWQHPRFACEEIETLLKGLE